MAKIHIHTKYSLLDAIIKPDELVKKLKAQGDTALCVTEHGNLYSDVEVYKLCQEYGIKYLLGCEMYICNDVTVKSKENKYYHLVVIAKNETGRLNLNQLVSKSANYKYYGKPRIDFDMLIEHKEGLIILSACMAGEVQRELMAGNYQQAKTIALMYQKAFGEDYYLEYQSHSEETQQLLNRQIVDLAKEIGVKFVVTTDAHYLNKDDQKYHNVFVQIGQAREVGETYNDCYVQSDQEILEICKSTTRQENILALQNTEEIAQKCNVSLPLSAPIMPHNPIPKDYHSEIEYLKHLCIQGWYDKKINLKPNINEYKERLGYEISVIQKMGFEGYYLFVHSYANSVNRRGIARGSGGGSLVAYLTNIVDIDPVEYGLYFERFIDVGALELLKDGKITKSQLKIPDFDLDFGKEDRNKVLASVIEQYGQDKVASLGSFQYIWAKGAIKDIGKVLDIPFDIRNEMTSKLDNETIEEVIELGLLDSYKQKYPDLFLYAEKLAGLPKSFSAHPCFPKGALVQTNNGYKEIQNVDIGDLVLTHNNAYKLVVKKTLNQTNNLIHLHGVGFFDIKCTPNHPFFVKHRTKKHPKEYSEPEWVSANNIVKSDMVCIPINNNNITPRYKNLPTANKDFWWIVGRYIGDGWCEYYEHPRNEKRVIICCNKNTINELDEIISRVEKLFDYRYIEESTTYKIFIQNNDIFEYLQRFGKYAHGKLLTNDIFDLPKELLQSFLDGYISADGYVDKHNYVNLKTVSYQLANGIIQCVGKAYHTVCTTHSLEAKKEIIENRVVQSKEKYIVIFKKYPTKNDMCFYDDDYHCLWCYVRDNKLHSVNECDVYNLSVVDDNSYTVNNVAVHNCGKVCSMKPITYYNATDINDSGEVILQGDMHTAEDLGLIKADFLGLRTVDVIYDTLDSIGKNYDYIAPHNLNFADSKVLKNFRDGFTSGIFQFESHGMKETLKKIECNSLYDLTVANALYRPGSMKYIDNYANRRKGIEEYEFLHNDLKPILKDSYGIIVFQEQLIEIGRLAKLSNPDELRKATAKKKAALLDKIKPELYLGLKNRGWTTDQLDTLWESMLDFARYSFNKSHAAAYAMIAYICMYLKTYHPREFMCAWINSVSDNLKKIIECVKEVNRLKIKIYQPSYNQCSPTTILYKDGIMFGINAVKYCNGDIARQLMSLTAGKKYSNFIELLDDINENTSIQTNQIIALATLNYFREFGRNKYLIDIINLYFGIKEKSKVVLPSMRTCKQISKEKIDSYSQFGVNEYIIGKFASSQTEKQYRNFDNYAMMLEFCKSIENKSYSLIEQIELESQYLGYVNYTNAAVQPYYYIVTEYKTYKDSVKPYITVRRICDGEEIKTKVKKVSVFKNNPFGLYSVLRIDGFTKEYKKTFSDGNWVTTDTMEDVLETYTVIK